LDGLLSFIVWLGARQPTISPTATNASVTSPSTALEQPKSVDQQKSEDTSKWTYSDSKDEMRGTTTRYASVDSENKLEFNFPYNGGATATLGLRQTPKSGLDIYVEVTKGQFLCHSFMNTHVSVKFDNGPIQRFSCTDTSDGRSTMIFIRSEGRFLAALRHAKKTVIEAEFYQAGEQQMIFDTAGLNWK
jgi:hypothetical protein